MNNINTFLRNEFVNGMKPFDYIFLSLGLVTQIVTYLISHDTTLSLISGILGVTSVVLTSQKKITMYVFSMAQIITYMILAFHEKLYAEVGEYVFYFVTTVIGIVIWRSLQREEPAAPEASAEPAPLLYVFFENYPSVTLRK